jgi:hypothetical protein
MHHQVISLAVLLWMLLKWIGRKMNIFAAIAGLGSHADEPIISSADLLTTGGLHSMANGRIGKYPYNLMTNRSGRVMMFITLDRNTMMHLVAIGNKSGLNKNIAHSPSRKWLEEVTLEGNFRNDFRMWCTKGRQMETRQVFGPETMAQFQDLCRAYNFELFHETVYITVAQGASDKEDTTTMVTDITNFMTHNSRVFDNI